MSEARRERALRERARRHFYHYCRYQTPSYPRARHLRLLCEALEEVERYVATEGEEGIGRLMAFMPPRHWKSQTVSVRFPAWVLGRNPDVPIITTSYAGDLAVGFSRQARNLISSPEYDVLFGEKSGREEAVRLSPDSQAAQDWHLDKFIGGVRAAGVGGGITGKGCRLLIIDDPHKDRKEAESTTLRRDVGNWYRSVAYTRLEKGAIVIILTRWHMEDLAGMLLKLMVEDPLADRWTVICLPAMAEEWAGGVDEAEAELALKEGWFKGADPLGREVGEPLWPEQFDSRALTIIKANVGGYDWVALFMQRPRKTEGQIIKANRIKIIEEHEVPAEVRPVRFWDLAVGRSARANWLAGALGGKDKRKRFYIMDMARIRPPWSEARPKIKQVMLRDPAGVVQGIEVVGQQDGYYQEFRDDEELQMRSIVAVNPRELGDKVARAQLWATRIEDDMVYMVRGPWNDDFIIECVGFPQAASDDQVDGVSGVWQMLPGVVEWSDVVQAANVPSRWNPFNEVVTWQR